MGVDTSFPVSVDCGVFSASSVVTVSAGNSTGSATVSGIPAGATCVVSEPVATIPAGWRFGSVTPGSITVGDGTTVDVALENERIPQGNFTITKELTGSFVDAPAVFSVDVDCDDDAHDQTVQVVASGASASASVTVGPIPKGTVCAVSEQPPGPGPWSPVAVVPSSVTVGIDAGAVATNARNLGQVTLEKEITGELPPGPVDFTIRLACTDNAFDGDHTVTVTPPKVSLRENDTVEVALTNDQLPGTVLLEKDIAGQAATTVETFGFALDCSGTAPLAVDVKVPAASDFGITTVTDVPAAPPAPSPRTPCPRTGSLCPPTSPTIACRPTAHRLPRR